MMYIQVDLQKGNAKDTAWIEDKKIEVGKVVEIKREDGVTDPGWLVTATYSRMTRDQMLLNRDAHKHQRKASDI